MLSEEMTPRGYRETFDAVDIKAIQGVGSQGRAAFILPLTGGSLYGSVRQGEWLTNDRTSRIGSDLKGSSHHSPDKTGKFSRDSSDDCVFLLSSQEQSVIFASQSRVSSVGISDDFRWVTFLTFSEFS